MSTSLKIFGETYNNVAGIKAKNVNDDTLTYLLPSDFTPSLSGNAITVEDTVDPTGGIIRSIEAVDISDSTITSSSIKTGYVGYTAGGIRVMGSMPEAVSGQTIYTSSNGIDYTPTMIIDVGQIVGRSSEKIWAALDSCGVMDKLVDLTLTGYIQKESSAGNIMSETSSYIFSDYLPNLKRLTVAPIESRNDAGGIDESSRSYFTFGHYALSRSNLRELTLGSLNGAYFKGGGYFRSDMPVPPGKNNVSVGSLDGLRLTIYTDQYMDLAGFYGGNVTDNVASNTIITQYNYLTGEELTA